MKIGVTGGIGSGKSLVVEEFKRLGGIIYQADIKAKELVYLPEIRSEIEAEFGVESFSQEHYNTKYIGNIVFTNPSKLEKLNAIIHPAVFRDFDRFCTENPKETIIYESALMMETMHTHLFDKIILVVAPIELRIERVMNRDKISKDEILTRISRQWDDEKKIPYADVVIHNINKEETIKRVQELWVQWDC